MKKIELSVNDEHVQTVMMILGNLKEGLIESIDGEMSKPKRQRAYVPKTDRVVYEDERPSGKYASAASYKSRLKKGK